MKRFIISVLCVSVFFVGLGTLVEKAGASFKSDEKAVDLIRKARIAIGGENAIASIQSLRIVGRTTKTLKVDGTDRTEQGETEIAMQLPDKLMKMVKLGHGDAAGGEQIIDKQVEVIVVGDAKDKMKVTVNGNGGERKIIIKKDDGTVQELTGAEADKVVAMDGGQGGESKTFIIKKADGTIEQVTGPNAPKTIVIKGSSSGTGEFTTSDGKTVVVRRAESGDTANWKSEDGKNIVISKTTSDHHGAMRQNEMLRLTLGLLLSAPQGIDVSYTYGGESDVDGTACNVVVAAFGGSSFKIFLGKSSNLPVMMTYMGHKIPQIMKVRVDAPKTGDPAQEAHVFARTMGVPAGEAVEFNVKFSDYRAVNGVQLPFRWVQTVGGSVDETFDVTNYEANPANIADMFKGQKIMVRTAKPAEVNK